jgi:hypothetical protein
MAFYLWMAIAIVSLTAVLACWWSALRRQMRLAVEERSCGHGVARAETLLASIRLLVALLDSDGADTDLRATVGREYLQLIRRRTRG